MQEVGVVFGCFCPMHKGHLDLVMRAKKENDLCIVICCGYDNDRGGKFLPLNKRYRYIKEYFKDDELVKVLKINDTELGIDKEWSIDNWKVWLKYAKDQIKKLGLGNCKIKWYVAEKKYEEELGGIYKEDVIYVSREENKISGTMIREKPIKYWDKIVKPFKKVFSHNILIIGTSSEGKTTLVRDIGNYFNTPFSYEKGRDVVTFKNDQELDCKDFVYNIYEQNKLNEELIDSSANRGIFISDTDNLVTLMYAKDYSKRENFTLTKDDYEDVLLPLVKMYARNIRWNKIFVLKPHEKFVDDGKRCMVNSSLMRRKKLYKILTDLLKEFNYEYEELNGNYYENYLTVKNYINKYLEGEENEKN